MKYFWYILILSSLFACSGPEPRRPVQVKTASFIKESAARNKALLAKEEVQIKAIIEADTLHSYQSSANGSWYYYNVKNETPGILPKPDDLVTLNYNIISFNNDTIYTNKEIGILQYKVDKEELFPGLRNSVKLLQENETATFLFPSSLAYGYPGDHDKIGTNVPIKSTVTILKIEQETDSIQK